MILYNNDQKWEFFNYLAERSSEVFISTYGLYTGITSSGNTVKSTKTFGARTLMANLNKPEIKSRILVGIPPFYSCKEDCPDCLSQRDKLKDRFGFHVNEHPHVNLAFTRKHHLKLYGFKSKSSGAFKLFTGGINFSCSDFSDVLVEVTNPADITELKAVFDKLWKNKVEPLEKISHWSFD